MFQVFFISILFMHLFFQSCFISNYGDKLDTTSQVPFQELLSSEVVLVEPSFTSLVILTIQQTWYHLIQVKLEKTVYLELPTCYRIIAPVLLRAGKCLTNDMSIASIWITYKIIMFYHLHCLLLSLPKQTKCNQID